MNTQSVSTRGFLITAALAAALAACLLCGAQPAWADSVQYVEKRWDETNAQVVSETKTAECTPITDSTTGISGWYVVNGNVDSSKRLVVSGTANIVLADGVKLYLKDGINVPAGTTLNIYAQSDGDSAGELYCDADTNDNAAIGSNELSGDCGTINIHGGKVTADTKTYGEDAAGIGGGEEGNGGTVIIYGGTVKAYGGSVNDEGGAGIGGGDCDDGKGGNGGTTVIYGGDVTAVGGANAAGIGGGDDGGDSNGGWVYIYGGTVNATGGSVNSRGGAGIGGGGTGGGKWIEIHGGEVTAQGGANAAGIGGGDEGGSGHIEIWGGTINATGGSENSDGGAGIGSGNEKEVYEVIIRGGNVTAQGGCDAAGIGGGDNGDGGTVSINGADAVVNATGGKYGAGIGGGQGKGGGKIYIRSGSVTAQGGANAAGIGGGESGTGGTITITGGTITATSVSDGAGIGGGDSGAGGTINISGGTVEATGGAYGAGIGGGDAANGGEINISSGTITATGGEDAAGIGGGEDGNGGTIDITGGTITATGGKNGAGVGGGQHGTGGTITIDSTTGELITAKSPEDGAGIGGGDLAGGGKITIENGKIKATGGSSHVIVPLDAYDFGGAGIGGGDGGDTGGSGPSGEITINGGDIEAQGGYSAAGIGAGKRSSCETVTITGGKIIAKGGTGTAFSEGRGGAGVGSGSLGSGSGTIAISGGDVTATGGANAAGVGGGYEVAGGTINISGGTVSATGGAYKDKGSSSTYDGGAGAGIGGGQGKSGGTITISGGTIEATGGASENTKAAGIGGGQDASDATNITLKYAEDDYDISVKASSYRYSSADTYVTLTMENPFKDKNTGDAFEATSYTGSDLDTFDDRTLVRANTYGVTVSEAENGSVAADKSRAAAGSTVTLTVTPDEGGWALKPGTLKALAGETELALTQDASDPSKYTFTMPEADVTVTAEFAPELAKFSFSVSFHDNIHLNVYVKDLVGDPGSYTVSYGPGEEGSEGWNTETLTSADENKLVVAERAAKEIGDEVRVIVRHDGDVIKDAQLSVKRYCDGAIAASGFPEPLKNICKATLDYGSYAQKAFGYKTDALVNGGNDYYDNASIKVPPYAAGKTDASDAITGASLSLVAASRIELVARFKTAAESAGGFWATVDDQEAAIEYQGGKLKIVVDGIAAKDLGVQKQIVVGDPAGGTYTFVVSPVDYMGLAVSSGVQVELNRALYNYYEKVTELLDSATSDPSLQSGQPSAASESAAATV